MEKLSTIDLVLKYKSNHLDCVKCSELTGNQNLSEKFLELSADEETEEFINYCFKTKFQKFKSSYIVPWLLYFYSLPDANALLGTGKMFIFSKNQLSKLFDNQEFENMLDIGAGDGHVTDKFQSFIKGQITCIESSTKMEKILLKKGFLIKKEIEGDYDLVSCLNVLDRCDSPISMLKSIRKIKSKNVIISIVLPFRGFYYNGNKKCKQNETLIGYYKNWEENVNLLCKEFSELGYKIEKIARVPYLSEGNYRKQMYSLDTAVFILS